MSLYYPAISLSLAGNHEEFNIPSTPLGVAVCQLRLIWGRVEGNIQPCILHSGVHYPGFQPVSRKEVYCGSGC